jgi:hypothetical protein
MSLIIDGTSGVTFNDSSLQGAAASPYVLKNRLINGAFQIAQRATSATITAGSTIAAGYSTVDRWYAYSTGANVTAAQVAGSGNNKNLFQITGAASVTAVGIGQRIEQLNSYDMASQTATLSVNIANSLLTSVTWTAYYANTADTFGTLASPTRTSIATGTFTVTSTLTNYNAQISIPAAATTGIEIVFTVGAQTSGTWQLGNVQLEIGSSATPFERRLYNQELAACQRYYEQSAQVASASLDGTASGSSSGVSNGSTTLYTSRMSYLVSKRVAPTMVFYRGSNTATANKWGFYNAGWIASSATTLVGNSENCFGINLTVTGTANAGGYIVEGNWSASAEL